MPIPSDYERCLRQPSRNAGAGIRQRRPARYRPRAGGAGCVALGGGALRQRPGGAASEIRQAARLGTGRSRSYTPRVEAWCNGVAAELLLPLAELEQILPPGSNPVDEIQNIRRRFKVSSLVVLRRLYEAGRRSDDEFEQAYEAERQRIQPRSSDGDNFYPALMARVGRRFAQAVVRNAAAGETLYRDAYGLLGIKKTATFNELRAQLGC